MMDGSWGDGWWWPGIVVMFVFMVFCMVMMARMMGGMLGSGSHESERHGSDVPERTLANRLASGEIDVDEYERLRDALQRSGESART
jgi:uncharacterized membrane protein